MAHTLFSPVSYFRQRVSAFLHRNDQLKAGAAERRDRWNRVMAAHQKPPERSEGPSKS
jgi:hypothetical protein